MRASRKTSYLFGTVLLATSTVAAAQSRSESTVNDRATTEHARDDAASASSPSITVNEDYRRDVGAGCTYRAEVHGVVRAVDTADRTAGAARYAPDLQVRAEVRCPNVRSVTAIGRVRGGAMDRDALAHAVAERAVIHSAVTGTICTYEPAFRFDGARVEGASLAQACRYTPATSARGGGPGSSDVRAHARQEHQERLERAWDSDAHPSTTREK